jgi:hypothetical protein
VIIPIPTGTRYVATLKGGTWKFVTCEKCRQPYAYLLVLEATGQGHNTLFLDAEGAAQQAREQAIQNYEAKSRNCVLPVPCPQCGFYQPDMVAQLKDKGSINALQVAGAVLVLLSFAPLAFKAAYAWVVTLVLAVLGVVVLALGYVVAFRFDPNAGDPEPRKAIGRQGSVWGERLVELKKIVDEVERKRDDPT